MRILVADQNALLLAAIVATFGRHCEVVTATCRDACMEHVERGQFDVVVACEKLADYTGLELLSEIEALYPATLRIFAARPESLRRLGKRLDLFGLLGTLSYPIEARKLVVALKVARTKLPARPKPPKAPPLVVRHIVLETEWDTGERLALLEEELEETPAPGETAAAAPEQTAGACGETAAPAPEDMAAAPEQTMAPAPEDMAAAPEQTMAPAPEDMAAAPEQTEASVPEEQMASPATLEVSFDENPSSPRMGVTQSVDADDSAGIHFAANDESVEEPPPPPEVPVVPSRPYCGDLAANDEGFEGEPTPARIQAGKHQSTTMALLQPQAPPAKSTAPQPGASRAAAIAKLAGASATPAAGAKKQNVAKGPRARKPTTPTAAQREAFQRALARRNAGRTGGVETQAQSSRGSAGLPGSRGSGKSTGSRNARAESPPIDFSNVRVPNTWVASGFGASPLPSQSLKEIARMATTKRPLPGAPRARQKVLPKRGIFVVGSGIAAVVLVGALCFELLRATPPVEHGRHAHAGGAQLFSPNSTLVADSSAGTPQVFSAPPRQPDQAPVTEGAAGMPQPQTFDPDTAPPDPPPPPALEHPGPMEPPSMAHNGPPLGLQGDPE
jgi:CheY-like chemotaxis protein